MRKTVAKGKKVAATSSSSSSGTTSRAGKAPLKVTLVSTRSMARKRVAAESVSSLQEVSNEDANVSVGPSASASSSTGNLSSKRRKSTTTNSNQAVNLAPIFNTIRSQPAINLEEILQEAFTNNLEYIMQLLPNQKDLQNCRLVSTAWQKLATEELLTRDCCRVVLEYREDKLKHYRFGSRGHSSYYDSMSVEALTKLVSSSPKFPCTNFVLIWARLDGADNDLETFVSTVGPTIKTLFIHPRPCRLSLICKLLMKIPNMDTLEISGLCNIQDDDEEDDKIQKLNYLQNKASSTSTSSSLSAVTSIPRQPIEISLPTSITSIEFSNTYPTSKQKVVENILVAASSSGNLESIHGLIHRDLELLIKLDLVHVLKSWATWSAPFAVSDIDTFTGSSVSIKLKKLAICANQDPSEEDGTVFIKILNQNRDSLEELEWGPMKFERGSKLPKLSKLKTLTLSPFIQGGQVGSRFFPTNSNLTTTFPTIKTITFLDFTDRQNGVEELGWVNHFPDEPIIGTVEGTFSSVTTLDFHGRSGTANFLKVMRPLCPSTRRIKLDRPNHFHNNREELSLVFSEIFESWKNLQTLQITVGELRVNLPHYYCLGLSQEDCDWQSRPSLQMRMVENGNRSGPWIGYVRGLTQWTVSGNPFRSTTSRSMDNNAKPNFGVAVKYPNETRFINPKLQQVLDTLAPFATIDTKIT